MRLASRQIAQRSSPTCGRTEVRWFGSTRPQVKCLGHVLLSWGRGGKYLISDFTGVAILQLIALTDGFDPASSGEVR
jgi:hypothetical protein